MRKPNRGLGAIGAGDETKVPSVSTPAIFPDSPYATSCSATSISVALRCGYKQAGGSARRGEYLAPAASSRRPRRLRTRAHSRPVSREVFAELLAHGNGRFILPKGTHRSRAARYSCEPLGLPLRRPVSRRISCPATAGLLRSAAHRPQSASG